MRWLLVWTLLAAWAAGPGPILGPSLPQGTELRLFSENLRVLYAAWRVEGNRLVPLSPPLRPEEGTRIRLVVARPNSPVETYEGVLSKGEVWLLLPGPEGPKTPFPLGQSLKEVYRLALASLWEGR